MKKVVINDLDQFKFLSGIQFNEDGKYGVFKVTKADVEKNKYLSDLWVYVVESGKTWQLTHSGTVNSFFWLDSENIIFGKKEESDDSKDNKERTILRKIYIHGGEGKKFLDVDFKASVKDQLDNGDLLMTVIVNKNKKNFYSLNKEEKEKELKKREEEKAYEIIEEVPFWSNGSTFNSGDRKRLIIYNKETKKIKEITPKEKSLGISTLNKDKTKIAITLSENNGKKELESKLYIYDIKTGKLKDLGLGLKRFHMAEFLDDNTLFLFINDSVKYGLNENAMFYTYDLVDEKLKVIDENLDISIGSSINSDMRYGSGEELIVKNGWIYYVETNDTDAILKRMDKNGKVEVLFDEKGSIDNISVDDSNNVLAIAMMENSLQELYKIKDGKAKKLTEFNDEYIKNHYVSETIELRSLGEGDDIIKGFVLKPQGYKKGTKYPGILVVHGGPKTAYGSVFIHEMQVWANEGYFVFFCNPKGSDGKGNEFADIRGRYGEVDYENIMDFCDKVLDTYPDIDTERLGVTGGSYGGFMTNWIIGHNNHFKCAASQRSISNWISFFGTSDIGYYFGSDQTHGWPWESHDKMWDQSPLKYADKVKTPTIFIHSSQDYRCWVPEAYQMFTALKVHGVESKLVLFHGENHELSRSGKPKNRIKRLEEITQWFNKYLKQEKKK